MKTGQHDGNINLPCLVLARICTSAIFMTYPACLDALLDEWRMSATQAGLVQGVFTAAFAISMLVSSFMSDRFGARRVFIVSCTGSAVTALIFALGASSFETGLLTIALVGLTQGGTYIPAVMVVSANVDPAKKSSGIGWVLAGMSGGYVISIFVSTSLLTLYSYELAFLATALFTVVGAIFGYLGVRKARDTKLETVADDEGSRSDNGRQSRLLILGYIGHTWELLGMWAWTPAFLAAALMTRETMSGVELGLWTALALHLSGFFSSFLSGYAADRFGARAVLIFLGALGCVCSAVIGWLPFLSVPLLLAIAAIYSFSAIGDSAVLSSAMTDAVPARHLGKVLGLRSVLGMGVGAVAPIGFGFALDVAPPDIGWGVAFSTLAMGGLIATVCALLLRR